MMVCRSYWDSSSWIRRLGRHRPAGLPEEEAMAGELKHGIRSLAEVQAGLERFRSGAGRHGSVD